MSEKPVYNAWRAYSAWSRQLVEQVKIEFNADKIRVLKADANNEAFGDDEAPDYCIRKIVPHILDLCDVSCLEISQTTVDKALEKYPDLDIRQGDVRHIPYDDETFHVILDLSTIDHVPDYPKALDEYIRVLKPGGSILIVVWLDESTHTDGVEQYWFEYHEFTKELGSRFEVLDTQAYKNVHGVPYPGGLFKFVARKNSMAWEYLDTPVFQTRFGIIAALLKGRTAGKTIVDLNCGRKAPLLNYLPRPFRTYVGNDIALEVPTSVTILRMPDSELPEWLESHVSLVDIFLHLGYGGHDLSKEDAESATELESGKAIVSHFKPELVILESVKDFSEHMRKQYSAVLAQYKVAASISLNLHAEGFVGLREFAAYEKD